MKSLSSFLAVSFVILFAGHDAVAESKIERITIMLSGSGCEAFHEHVETAIGRLDGVRAVDGRSIPGHMLIDVENNRVTADQLAGLVTDMATADKPCRAGVMESCVTAGSQHTMLSAGNPLSAH